jgi:hypothetical protein
MVDLPAKGEIEEKRCKRKRVLPKEDAHSLTIAPSTSCYHLPFSV